MIPGNQSIILPHFKKVANQELNKFRDLTEDFPTELILIDEERKELLRCRQSNP
jgi:hypothetical protein